MFYIQMYVYKWNILYKNVHIKTRYVYIQMYV